MPTLQMNIRHSLSEEEAVKRIKNLLTDAKKEHGDKIQNLVETWSGNQGLFSFKAQGFDISGTITVNSSSVDLNGKIPFAVSLFKGKISRIIEDEANRLLRT